MEAWRLWRKGTRHGLGGVLQVGRACWAVGLSGVAAVGGDGRLALVAGESVDAWKDYLKFHLVEHYALVLPKAVAAEHFAFFGGTLWGAADAGHGNHLPSPPLMAPGPGGRPALHAKLFSAGSEGESQRPWPQTCSAPFADAFQISPGCLHRRKRRRWPSLRPSRSSSATPTRGSTTRRSTWCAATPSGICGARKPSIVRATLPG